MGHNMKEDFCVRCGSENLEIKTKDIQFNLINPGPVAVSQECKVCGECGEVYFNSKQMEDLSEKIKNKILIKR